MKNTSFEEALGGIVRRDPRYTSEAYHFVREGLDYTIKMLEKPPDGIGRHVSGGELLDGLRRYAIKEFGPITKTVLNKWGICECIDFGYVVFNLVEEGILGRTKSDRVEDFADGYSFEDAFITPFLPEPPAKISLEAPQDEPTEVDESSSSDS